MSLALKARESSYEETNPLVPVSISKNAADGATLSLGAASIGVAPSQAGEPEASEIVGNSVFYPGVSTDADFLLEPTPLGVEASWQLLSQASPESNSLTFSLPVGASVVLSKTVEGAAEVVSNGVTMLVVQPAVATQADGTNLPVSYSISGNTLTAHVSLAGSVDFPVMVDPTITQGYGAGGPQGDYWAGWGKGAPPEPGAKDSYWEGGPGSNYILAGISPNSPDTFTAWSVFAPGWETGEGSITRVWVGGLQHLYAPSWLEAGFEHDKGTSPVWTYNGESAAATEAGPLLTREQFSGASSRDAEFCAQGAGGAEGKSPGLCNEAYGAGDFHLSVFTSSSLSADQSAKIEDASVEYLDASHVTTTFAPGSTINGYPNALYGSSNWFGPDTGYLEYTGSDPSFGVAGTGLEVWKGGKWEVVQAIAWPCNGYKCAEQQHVIDSYETSEGTAGGTLLGSHLPEGLDRIKAGADDLAGVDTEVEGTIKVDASPPKMSEPSGLPKSGETYELTETEAHLKVEATDGVAGTDSSGVAWIELGINGHRRGSQGSCTPGPCTAHGEWALNGAELSAGYHELDIKAQDYAGNTEEKTYGLYVYHSSPVAMGPGSVNLQSGDFAMDATDVSFGTGAGALTVTRHFDSRNPEEGKGGTLGPQWTIGLEDEAARLEEQPNGDVQLMDAEGFTAFTSRRHGEEYVSPTGDSTLTLTKLSGPSRFRLENKVKGTTLEFGLPKKAPEGATEWFATASRGPVATSEITAEYEDVMIEGEPVTEPVLELAPHSTLSCPPKESEWELWQRGCRGLFFKYAPAKDGVEFYATGEGKSEWGDYPGRLEEISAVAYNPASAKMEKQPVAEYGYDSQGRLRDEWNPATPTLKTMYGYESGESIGGRFRGSPSAQITAVTPAGEEPWLLTFGSIEGDKSTGRLIKVERAPATKELWKGRLPGNEEAPKVSGTPVVGNSLSVSPGKWGNGADTYAYYWQDCDGSGGECSRIEGATNPTYIPKGSDVGHELVAEVAATNTGGTVVAHSTPTAAVKETGSATKGEPTEPAPGATIEYNVPVEGSGAPYNLSSSERDKWNEKATPVNATSVFAPESDQGWPASDHVGATVYYVDSQGRTVNVATPTGGISTTEYNEANNVTRTLSAANRAAALKEPSPGQAAEELSTESKYAEEGAELTETLGPRHKVRLSGGSEREARQRNRYTYDQGAPAGEEAEDLVTTETAGALLASGEEVDVRTTTKSYSGQDGIGWKLREPTSVTVDPAGLHLTTSTEYSESGAVERTISPAGNSQPAYPPAFHVAFGQTGTAYGDFNGPQGVATDSAGNVWVADQMNDRVEEFSGTGSPVASYPENHAGEQTLTEPMGVAINQTTGTVYVTEAANSRISTILPGTGEHPIQRFTISGATLHDPVGIAVDEAGDVWVADDGLHQVLEFSESGTFIRALGGEGTGPGDFEQPWGIALAGGDVYVSDSTLDRVQKFSGAGVYLASFGKKGSGQGEFEGALGIAVAPVTDQLYVVDHANKVEEFTPDGGFLDEFAPDALSDPSQQMDDPAGIAVNATGEIYLTNEQGNQVAIWLPPGTGGTRMLYSTEFGSKGSGTGTPQFKNPMGVALDAHSDLWVTDGENDRVERISPTGEELIGAYGKKGSGSKSFESPDGIAVNQSTGNVYVSDCGNNRVQELNEKGEFINSWGEKGTAAGDFNCPAGIAVSSSGNVWVVDRFNNRIQEFSPAGKLEHVWGIGGPSEGDLYIPEGIALANGSVYVTEAGLDRVEEFTPTPNGGLAFVRRFGGPEGTGSGEFNLPEGITADPAGNIYVSDRDNGRVEEFSPTGIFLAEFGTAGTGPGHFNAPHGLAIDPSGDLYAVDSENDRVQEWVPERQAAHDTRTIYYSAGEIDPSTEENHEYKEADKTCSKHPEWENLPCYTGPAAQPDDKIAPSLPAATTEYSFWDQPETTVTTVGSTSRTTHTTFDSAGRPETTEEIACVGAPTKCDPTGDAALPKVTDTYDPENGLLETQTSTGESPERRITSKYNSLGELSEYTDADGASTKYTYDSYGRTRTITTEKGEQTYHYADSLGTGELEKLTDSGAGTFEASYGVEGQLTTESYPNGMKATYTYNAEGRPATLTYDKTTACSSACEWFTDSSVPSIHGETAIEQTSLAKVVSSYDAAGRLTEVRETPTVSQECTSRLYSYDEDSDRTSLTTRPPNSKKECATEGGAVQAHRFDEGDRLTDEGVRYEPFDNVSALPAADSGGHELATSYYVDGQAATQSQKSESGVSNTLEYRLDPEERTRETVVKGEKAGVVVTHYAGPGDAVAWTKEGGNWTRNVPGMAGELVATEHSGAPPVLLLHDLQGNIVAEAAINETAAKLLSTYESTEFGVPTTSTPPTYNWLGAAGVKSELPSGAIAQDGATYVPLLGGPLQTERPHPPIPTINVNETITFPMPPVTAGAATAKANVIDPGKCVGKGNLGEEAEYDEKPTEPGVAFGCTGPGIYVTIQLCVFAYESGFYECTTKHFATLPKNTKIVLKTFQCTGGEHYRLRGGYKEGLFGKWDFGYGQWEECEATLSEKEEEIGIAKEIGHLK